MLDLANLPAQAASGCIVSYRGRRFVLTAAHATENQGRWAIEIGATQDCRTELYQIGPMTFLARGSLDRPIRRVDLAFAEIPEHVEPRMQAVRDVGTIEWEVPRVVIETNLDVEPSTTRRYGFSGITRMAYCGIDLRGELRHEIDMEYVGIEDDLHAFRLAHEHPGHEAYHGCSGAPILDDSGNPVALVINGDVPRRLIFGTPLSRYRVALDVACGEVR
jgi:hypothetical protein